MSPDRIVKTAEQVNNRNVPITQALRDLAESGNIHFSLILPVLKFLERGKHIETVKIDYKGRRKQKALEPEQKDLFDYVATKAIEENLFDLSFLHKRDALLKHVAYFKSKHPSSRNGSS